MNSKVKKHIFKYHLVFALLSMERYYNNIRALQKNKILRCELADVLEKLVSGELENKKCIGKGNSARVFSLDSVIFDEFSNSEVPLCIKFREGYLHDKTLAFQEAFLFEKITSQCIKQNFSDFSEINFPVFNSVVACKNVYALVCEDVSHRKYKLVDPAKDIFEFENAQRKIDEMTLLNLLRFSDNALGTIVSPHIVLSKIYRPVFLDLDHVFCYDQSFGQGKHSSEFLINL